MMRAGAGLGEAGNYHGHDGDDPGLVAPVSVLFGGHVIRLDPVGVVGGAASDGDYLAPPPLPPAVESSATDRAWRAVATWYRNPLYQVASIASAGLCVWHGYRRTGSAGWALAWGFLGSILPVVAPVLALAQGFGKPARRSNPGRRGRRRSNPRLPSPVDFRELSNRAAQARIRELVKLYSWDSSSIQDAGKILLRDLRRDGERAQSRDYDQAVRLIEAIDREDRAGRFKVPAPPPPRRQGRAFSDMPGADEVLRAVDRFHRVSGLPARGEEVAALSKLPEDRVWRLLAAAKRDGWVREYRYSTGEAGGFARPDAALPRGLSMV